MAIDLANNGYNPSVELTQVKASPSLQDVQVRRDKSKAVQLMEQFGNLEPQIKESQKIINISEKDRAEALVHSMTTDELAQKIKDDPSSLSSSPVFNATVNKLHYKSIADGHQAEIFQRIDNGEFQSDPENTKYDANGALNPKYRDGNQKLQEAVVATRNAALGGADRFGVAGYDADYHQFLAAAGQKNSAVLHQQSINFASSVATDYIKKNVPDNLTPAQLTESLTASLKAVRLPSGAIISQKALLPVYDSILQKFAYSGEPAKVEAVLNTPLDNGLKIRDVIGRDGFGAVKAEKFLHEAMNAQRILANRSQVEYTNALIDQDKVARKNDIIRSLNMGEGYKYPTRIQQLSSDGIKTVPTENMVYDIAVEQTQGMSRDQRTDYFLRNHIIDRDLKATIDGASFSNVDTALVNPDGTKKEAGTISKAANDGIDAWLSLRKRDEGGTIAAQYTSSEMTTRLESMYSLMSYGFNRNKAATTMSMMDNSPENKARAEKAANTIVAKLDPNWFSTHFMGQDAITGNLNKVQGEIKSVVGAMAAAGLREEDIIKQLGDHVAENYVNVQGSLISRQSLPLTGIENQIDGGAGSIIKSYTSAVAVQIAATQGINPDEVSVMMDSNTGTLRFMARGMPLEYNGTAFTKTKDQYSQWANDNISNIQQDVTYNDERKAYRTNLQQNPEGITLSKLFSAEHISDPMSREDKYLSSPAGYRALVQAGLAKNPYRVLDKGSVSLSAGVSEKDRAILDRRDLPRGNAELRQKQLAFAREKLNGGASWNDTGVKLTEPALPDLKDIQVDPKTQDPSTWGHRQDGTNKGSGFLGVLKRPDGGVSTELSISTEAVRGRDFPLLVPTLTREEVQKVLAIPEDTPHKEFFKKLPKGVVEKAEAFAERRVREGKPLFATPNESPAFTGGK